jgi:single-strand DNA-binding protein
MGRYINKVQLLGNLGAEPEVRNFPNGGRVVTFSVATTDYWNDRASGERRERTTWHRVTVWADGLMDVAEKYLRKGSKVLVEGKLEYNEWTDREGVKRTSVELAIRPFHGELILLDAPEGRDVNVPRHERETAAAGASARSYGLPRNGELDQEVPF